MHRIKINNDLVFPIFPKKIIFFKKLNFLSIHVQYNNYFTLETSHPTFLSDGVKQ